jgi:hypothetical protein
VLFGTNSLKKGAMWRIHAMQDASPPPWWRGRVSYCDITGQCRTPPSPPAAT